MPTFIVFKNQKEVQRVQGANIQALNAAVMNLAREAEAMQGASGSASGGFGSGQGSTSGGVWSGAPVAKGYQDIAEEIEKKALDIMNANTEVGSARVLFESTQPGKDPKARDWVESDTDEQLMIYIPFQSTLKLHSIHITSLPPYSDDDDKVKRPRTLKLYANRPTIVGFEEAEGMIPTQKVTLTADDWDKETGTAVINTKFVKFQSVFSLTIFVFEGEDDCDRVRIDRIKFVGEPREKREPGKLEKVGEGQE